MVELWLKQQDIDEPSNNLLYGIAGLTHRVKRPTQHEETQDLGHSLVMSLQVKISYYGREENEISVAWLYLTCVGMYYDNTHLNLANPFQCHNLIWFMGWDLSGDAGCPCTTCSQGLGVDSLC